MEQLFGLGDAGCIELLFGLLDTEYTELSELNYCLVWEILGHCYCLVC